MNLCAVCNGWQRVQFFRAAAIKVGRPEGHYHRRCMVSDRPLHRYNAVGDVTRHVHRSVQQLVTRQSRVLPRFIP